MSYLTLALLTRARSNRLAALSVRQQSGQQSGSAQMRRPHDTIVNVFADID